MALLTGADGGVTWLSMEEMLRKEDDLSTTFGTAGGQAAIPAGPMGVWRRVGRVVRVWRDGSMLRGGGREEGIAGKEALPSVFTITPSDLRRKRLSCVADRHAFSPAGSGSSGMEDRGEP